MLKMHELCTKPSLCSTSMATTSAPGPESHIPLYHRAQQVMRKVGEGVEEEGGRWNVGVEDVNVILQSKRSRPCFTLTLNLMHVNSFNSFIDKKQ